MSCDSDDSAILQMLACPSGSSIDALIRRGFPISAVDHLSVQGIDAVAVGFLSAHRVKYCRQRQRCLTQDESDHLYRLCKVLVRAESVFGDHGKALTWLESPRVALGGLSALEAVITTPGYESVDDELERLSSGYCA